MNIAEQAIPRGLVELAKPTGAIDLSLAVEPLVGPGAERYRELVGRNRLTAALVDALTQAGLPVDDELALALADHQAARLQIRRTMGMVAEALADRVPWVVLKGPAVAAIMSRPELRTYNDLDLLVPGAALADTIDLLTDAGIRELNQNWEPYLQHRVGQLPMAGPRTTVDLHWDPIAFGRVRDHIKFDVAAMLARRKAIPIEGFGDLPVLEPVDQLLHLATHCALSGAARLDQLRDLRTVAAMISTDQDWNEFRTRAGQIGVLKLVANALDRSDRLIGVDSPEGLMKSMGGTTLPLRRRIDDSLHGLRRFPVENLRDRPSATMQTFASRVNAAIARRASGPKVWDFADKQSELYYQRVSGDASTRRAFMTMAARTPKS